ncbi:MAG: signal peptidase I [Clostridiales bacterium]|nr:signal peptidase I [Clostridiales bacterium]
MVLLILLAVPLTVPKILGIQIYAVLSGSMEPEYQVNSVIYVKPCDSTKVNEGDVITFHLIGETDIVMTHRVVSIDQENQSFITKGDANYIVDKDPVSFDRLIGKPFFSIPGLAKVSDFIHSSIGIAVCIFLFSFVLALWILADAIKRELFLKQKEETKTLEKKKKGFPLKILSYIGILCIMLSLCGLGYYLIQYQAGSKEYNQLSEYVKNIATQNQSADETKASEDVATQSTKPDQWKNQDIVIDFEALTSQNNELAGWIVFDQLPINYPIMYSGENEYYLTHTFGRNENSSGALFMDAVSKKDFNEYQTIIYGHNMKNGSMFGSLKKYKDYDFYKENAYFTLCTPKVNYRYQIFSCCYVDEQDEVEEF